MEQLDVEQIWRQVPPEEKFELMAMAHSRGMFAAVSVIIIGGTLAVGLNISWLLWGSLLLSPIIFQGASSKSWSHLRPRVLLEYLAARSASRRFAFSLNSTRLSIASLIRGRIAEVQENRSQEDVLEEKFSDNKDKEVWIALFHDALIVISEQAGGAKLELGQLLAKNISINGVSPSEQGDYSLDRELHVEVSNHLGIKRKYRLTSKYPAALIVMEKKAARLIAEAKEARNLVPPEQIAELIEDENSFMSF